MPAPKPMINETNDIAEMGIDKVTEDIKPLISKIQGVYL